MNQSKLRFSIEESVWLKKGQEVAEVLSMSLEPDIAITEENDHVYIKGALKLVGEYRPYAQAIPPVDFEAGSLREQVSYRSLTQLTMKDDGIAELEHRFPVDITIPASRVTDSREVYVAVESFDYELPNPTCLELSAAISISGIYEENVVNQTEEEDPTNEDEALYGYEEEVPVNEPVEMEEVEEEAEEVPIASPHREDEQMFSTFQFEAKKFYDDFPVEPLTPSFLEPLEIPERPRETTVEFKAMEEPARQDQTDESVSTETWSTLKSIASESKNELEVQNELPSEPRPEEIEVEEQETAIQESMAHEVEVDEEVEVEESVPEAVEVSGMVEIEEEPPAKYSELAEDIEVQEIEEKEHGAAGRDENALYLTKMLSGGNEEKFAKVKMYIIQRGDSLDSVCDKYDITLNTLLRVNRIKQEEVTEGQIIYIPVAQTR